MIQEAQNTAPQTDAKPAESGQETGQIPQNVANVAAKYAEEGDLDKVLKFKINGQVVEKTVRELAKLDNLNEASTQRFTEAAWMRKEAEAMKEQLLSDPIGFAKKHGLDFKKVAFPYLRDEIAKSELSPEELRLIEREEAIAKKEQEHKEREMTEKQRIEQQQDMEVMNQIKNDFIQALQTFGQDLPDSGKTIAQMAWHAENARRNGIPITMEQLVAAVRKDYDDIAQERNANVKTMSGEEFEKRFGTEQLMKLAQYASGKIKRPSNGVSHVDTKLKNGESKDNGRYNPYAAEREAIMRHSGAL